MKRKLLVFTCIFVSLFLFFTQTFAQEAIFAQQEVTSCQSLSNELVAQNNLLYKAQQKEIIKIDTIDLIKRNFDSLFNLGLVYQTLNIPSDSYLIYVTTKVGEGTILGSSSILLDSEIEQDTVIGTNALVGSSATIKENSRTGSFLRIARRAKVDENAKLGNFVYIGQNTIIEENVNIGDLVSIGGNSLIAKDAIIGNNVTIGSNVLVKRKAVIENNVSVGSDVIIGEEAFIGIGNVINSGARISDGSIIPAIVISLPEVICRPNPFIPQNFDPIPYKSCEQIIENKETVRSLINSWNASAANCHGQVDSLMSQLEDAIDELTDQLIASGELCDSSSILLAPLDPIDPLDPLPATDLDSEPLLDHLKTCRDQLKSVCNRAESIWKPYEKTCNKINGGEICGTGESIINGYINYLPPQADLAEWHIKDVLYPNSQNTCKNLLEILETASSSICADSDLILSGGSGVVTKPSDLATPITIIDLLNASRLIAKFTG